MTEELKIKITAQVDKLKQGVQEAKKAVEKFTEDSEKGASQMDEAFKTAGDGIKNTLTNAAKVGATAIAGLGTALLGTAAATSEYRVAQAKLNTAFEAAGATVGTASQTYNDLYRVLGDSDVAVEAANHLAKLTTNQKDLSTWTNVCQGIYATFGDSLPIEGLTEAANETAKVGAVTGPLADALNWAGVQEDAFNEKLAKCATEQEREALIRDTLNGLYSEAAAGYEKNASGILAQNEAQAKLQSNLAKIGETMQPLLANLTTLASDVLAKIAPYIQQIGEKYGPTLKEVLSTTAGLVKEVIGYVVDNWGMIAGIAGVIGGIAIAIGMYNTVAAIKAAMAAAEVTTVWALVSAYIAQAAAMAVAIAPYVLIVAAIAAVIAIIVLCVKHWDEIKEAIGKAMEWIAEKVKAGFDKVIGFFQSLWEGIKSIVGWIVDGITERFNAIKETISNIITGVKDVVLNIFNLLKTELLKELTLLKTQLLLYLMLLKQQSQNQLKWLKILLKE
jgi:phage-related protein